MTAPASGVPSHGLVIREPWIGLILAGAKTWELRRQPTHRRGPIALIRSGSGLVVGEAQVRAVHGPLDAPDLQRHAERHRVPEDQLLGLNYPQVYAWELAEAVAYPTPRPYDHPRGAIIWVKLGRS